MQFLKAEAFEMGITKGYPWKRVGLLMNITNQHDSSSPEEAGEEYHPEQSPAAMKEI